MNNTGNPIGSKAFPDFEDNVKNLDQAVNAEQDTFQDRLGKSRLTWAGIVKAGSGDPAIAVDAAARAEAAASQVQQDAEQIAQDAAQQAVQDVVDGVDGQVAVAEAAADRAEAEADRAEAASDAAFVNADVYPDVATGRAAVADGEQFQVVSDNGSDLIRYRRDSASVSVEVAKYPTAGRVSKVEDALAEISGSGGYLNTTVNSGTVEAVNLSSAVNPNFSVRREVDGLSINLATSAVGVVFSTSVVTGGSVTKLVCRQTIINKSETAFGAGLTFGDRSYYWYGVTESAYIARRIGDASSTTLAGAPHPLDEGVLTITSLLWDTGHLSMEFEFNGSVVHIEDEGVSQGPVGLFRYGSSEVKASFETQSIGDLLPEGLGGLTIDGAAIADTTITPEKTSFIQVTEFNHPPVFEPRVTVLVNDGGPYILVRPQDGAQSTYSVLLEPNTFVSVKKVGGASGSTSRFLVVVMDQILTDDLVPGNYTPYRVINDDNALTEVEFKNDAKGKQVFVYINPGSTSNTVEVTQRNVTLVGVDVPGTSNSDEGGGNPETEMSFGLEISAIQNPEASTIDEVEPSYLALVGVKVNNSAIGQQAVPIGWLYINDTAPFKYFYSSGVPDNPKYLCDWRSDLTWNNNSPAVYYHYILKNGDILNVYRGEFASSQNARQNPIIYPASDYNSPFIVDFGDRLKPTATTRAGFEYVYNADCFFLAEYTRPVHMPYGYVWKVEGDAANPDNWRTVMQMEITDPAGAAGFKHFHLCIYDPFSQSIVLSSGDDNNGAKFWVSKDVGETWELQQEGSERYARASNLVFTEEAVYWASDSHGDDHRAYMAVRDEQGFPDLSIDNIEELFYFPTYGRRVATYCTAYIRDPNGLLFLDRDDSGTSDQDAHFEIWFWSFETDSAHLIATIPVLEGPMFPGFRSMSVNWLQGHLDDRIVCGFGLSRYPHILDVLGNSIERPISNLTLRVVRKLG